jgi:hypothetical protein
VPAGKPRRITVLIVDVDFNSQARAFLHAELPKAEPLRAEILSHQAGTRVNEHPTHTLRFELGQLVLKAGPIEFVIPHPQGHGAVLRGRVREGRAELGGRQGRACFAESPGVEQQIPLGLAGKQIRRCRLGGRGGLLTAGPDREAEQNDDKS